MAAISWIKLSVNIFDDEKIRLIKSMPEGDAIILIWIQLLCLAGKTNDGGEVYIGQNMYYTDEMLSTICDQPLNTVRLALKTFEQFEMVSHSNDGLITIENWEKHQNIEGMERVRERARLRKRRQRERDCHVTSRDSHATDIDIDIDKDRDIDIISSSHNKQIIELWNSLDPNIPQITALNSGTQRYKLIKARINEYGFDKVAEAINNIKLSKFLKGYVTDFTITFDWFIRPNNFVKVLEGNYTDKGVSAGKLGSYQEEDTSITEATREEFEMIKKEMGL